MALALILKKTKISIGNSYLERRHLTAMVKVVRDAQIKLYGKLFIEKEK